MDLDQHECRPRAAGSSTSAIPRPDGPVSDSRTSARTAAPYPRGMELQEIVRAALDEDVGSGDATTLATVDPERARAGDDHAEGAGRRVRARGGGGGRSRSLDGGVAVERLGPEGVWQDAGTEVLRIEGSARGAPHGRARRAEPAPAPQRRRHADGALRRGRRGHRRADPRHPQDDAGPAGSSRRPRSAPAAGTNHRTGLYDAILIKENHVAAAGGVRAGDRAGASRLPRPAARGRVPQRRARSTQALEAGAPRLLLDNMAPGRAAGPLSTRSRAAPSSRRAAGSRSKRSGTTQSRAYTSSRSERSRTRPPP